MLIESENFITQSVTHISLIRFHKFEIKFDNNNTGIDKLYWTKQP